LTKALLLLAPAGIPRLDQAGIHARVLLFATVTTIITGMGVGLLPAIALTRGDFGNRLRGTRVVAGRGRLHASLVIAQLALACVLLVGAGLLTRTLINLDRVDPGFDTDGLVGLRVAPDFRRFNTDGAFAPQLYARYVDEMRDAIAGLPGVTEVAITDVVPLSGDRGNNEVWAADRPVQPGDSVAAERSFPSANYMDVVRMRRLEGRFFTGADEHPDAPTAVIINDALARRLWPGESAIGRVLGFWQRTGTVVGVVANTRVRALDIGTDFHFFVPRGQGGSGGSFVIRVADGVDPASLAPALRQRVWSVDPAVPITSIMTLRQRAYDSLADQRFRARLMIAFGGFATLFAVLGIYGVTSRSVAARTREIGIRMALGERPRGVVRLVLRQGVRLAAAGAVIGLLGGMAASRALASFLYETSTVDALTLMLVAVALAVLALLASVVPSLRASRVDPVVALRAD
jgi:predicted permease